jgi:hypothetical protein
MLATENAPSSQPARVNGTQGAGWTFPRWSTICGTDVEPSLSGQ